MTLLLVVIRLLLPADLFKGVYDKFDTPEVLPVVKVGPVHVAEAWHGPTGVFKDLTLPALARLCNHFLEKKGQKATILVSTTGDTGSATIHSALGMKNLRVIVMYPRYTVSRIQELQMTTTGASNAIVFSHEGTSDDIDVILRKIFTDPAVRKEHILMSFNSIHTVRVILNIVHYIFMYLRVAPNADRKVLISVPTGGMGNAVGGFMAAGMGLPIEILSAVNENDIVHRAFTLGEFSITKPMVPTYAMSLDSLLPHNIERVFFHALEGDCDALKDVMEKFENEQKSILPGKILQNTKHLLTASVDMEQCLETMGQVWKEHSYAVCPHTAVAWRPAVDYTKNEIETSRKSEEEDTAQTTEEVTGGSGGGRCDSMIVIATATPAKFPETLGKVGVPVPSVAWAEGLAGREERKLLLNKGEDWEKRLRETIAGSAGYV